MDADGDLYSYLETPGTDSITLAPGYDFSKEPRAIYTTGDLCEFIPRRKFPDQVLSCDTIVVSSTQSQPQSQPQPTPEPEPSIITGLKGKLQQSHDQQVDMLRGLGVDACKVYKEKRVETVVSHITPGTKFCKFCNKVLKNTQKLKSHIRSRHSKGEAYECSVCSKKVGNAFALKVHMHLHESDGKKHQCHVCGKRYLTLSKLNEHASKHSKGRLTCTWCNKSFSEKKGLQDHYKRCKKRPGYEDLSWEETHPRAGTATVISPEITTKTVTPRKAILMLNNAIEQLMHQLDSSLWQLDS